MEDRKVYVVVNNTLHNNSSYWRVVDVFDKEIDARVCIAADKENFLKGVDRGDFHDWFNEMAEDPDMFINTDMWDDYVVSETGNYECWRVESYELK